MYWLLFHLLLECPSGIGRGLLKPLRWRCGVTLAGSLIEIGLEVELIDSC